MSAYTHSILWTYVIRINLRAKKQMQETKLYLIVMKRYWLLVNHVGVYENINVVRRSEIYKFDRADVY